MMMISRTKHFIKKTFKKLGLSKRRNQYNVRRDVEIIPIQPNLELVVYWKILPIGRGPTVNLKAFDCEILRFDCFGEDKGHYHIAPDFETRIHFSEKKAIDQIHRTATELQINAQKHLKSQTDERINKLKIDQEKFSVAIQKAELKMTTFLQSVPELVELL